MYSPDISQHSPRLYRLGKRYGVPMTKLANRLIAFGLQRLEEVFKDLPEDVTENARLVAEDPTPYGVSKKSPIGDSSLSEANRNLCETVCDLSTMFIKQPHLPDDSRELVRLSILWAEEFERQNAGETWADREYLEVIETFFHDHYRDWLNPSPPRSVKVA